MQIRLKAPDGYGLRSHRRMCVSAIITDHGLEQFLFSAIFEPLAVRNGHLHQYNIVIIIITITNINHN